MDEYQLAEFDESKGNTPLTRTASNTKVYADAAREVGRELGVAVTDLWGAFMAVAGWRDGQGQPLAGSREVERNEKLEGLFTDG